MAKSKATVTVAQSDASVREITSMVKKDIASLKAHADRLTTFLNSPGAAAIRVCECCINITISKPGEEQQVTRGKRRK